MLLSPGARLGPYEVTGAIGAGGMGEVYRARDTRLQRDVALKVLPDAVAADLTRMGRFEREAQTLAALNHPHIAAIYGIEEGRVSGTPDGVGDTLVRALVLELVEGETLAERIARGPLPPDEALPLARQICEALEAAHEHGVVHRDLKPANIKVTPDGAVKVLDFGLAKSFDEGPLRNGVFASGVATMAPPPVARPRQDLDRETTESPTKASPAFVTGVGVLLGTVAYMPPEQARGRVVDKRADIWAFGCVLFEMLTGAPPFGGETPAETLAAILKDPAPFGLLPPGLPAGVDRLVRRCIEKDLRQRLRDIGEARIAIERIEGGGADAEPVPVVSAPGRRRSWLGVVAAAVAALVAAAALLWGRAGDAPAPVRRLSLVLPFEQSFPADANTGPVFAFAPDGNTVVYVADQGDSRQLYVRKLDGFEPRPLPGTENARAPFFSPDSQWVGFFADGKLKKVPLAGGAPIPLADAEGGLLQVGAWNADETIVFPAAPYALFSVPASGGTPVRVTGPDSRKGENNVCCPAFLPGTGSLLMSTSTGAGAVQVAVFSPATKARVDLMAGGSPTYVQTGHLLYVQDGVLMAVPFDPGALRATGPSVPVVDGVAQTLLQGVAQYSLSSSGALAYMPGRRRGASSRLVWVDRSGAEEPVPAPSHAYRSPRLSPDGRRIAVGIDELGGQVWTYDLERDTLTRVTFGGEENGNPAWSPDGTLLAFSSAATGSPGSVYVQPSDGTGKAERLAVNEYRRVPNSWSADGQLLAFHENNPETAADIWVMRMRDRQVTPFVQAPFAQSAARFSPDGRWMAYVSSESGRQEVYVQAYPGPGGKWQVSADGGSEPVWNPNGRELFFRQGNRMFAVELTTRPTMTLGKPRALFDGPYELSAASLPAYDVSRDGLRFLMVKETEQAPATQINIVLNWVDELKRLVPRP